MDEQDPKALAAAILQLYTETETRTRLERGARKAAERVSVRAWADEIANGCRGRRNQHQGLWRSWWGVQSRCVGRMRTRFEYGPYGEGDLEMRACGVPGDALCRSLGQGPSRCDGHCLCVLDCLRPALPLEQVLAAVPAIREQGLPGDVARVV